MPTAIEDETARRGYELEEEVERLAADNDNLVMQAKAAEDAQARAEVACGEARAELRKTKLQLDQMTGHIDDIAAAKVRSAWAIGEVTIPVEGFLIKPKAQPALIRGAWAVLESNNVWVRPDSGEVGHEPKRFQLTHRATGRYVRSDDQLWPLFKTAEELDHFGDWSTCDPDAISDLCRRAMSVLYGVEVLHAGK